MHTHENNSSSNYFTEETAPGSGQYYLCIKDMTKHYRGLTYGFYLDIPDDIPDDFPDDFPDHLVYVIKPHLIYEDFDYGKVFSVKTAIGAEPWMALSVADKALLSHCQLIKVGTAHIQLQHEARSSVPVPPSLPVIIHQ